MITENKVVTLNYILREDSSEGLLIENTYEGQPLEFIYGIANMMPAFEKNIEGLEEGKHFSFPIDSSEAYGDVNPKAIVDLDINIFKVHDRIDYDILKIGNKVPMQDSNGNRMDGLVLELNDSKVKMDFNHPLAGKNLYFEGEVLGIREATEEELSHGHTHQAGGCGCGSGSGGGCCSTEEQHSHQHQEEDSCGCGSGCGCH